MNKYGQTLRQAGVSVPDLPNKLFFSIREVSVDLRGGTAMFYATGRRNFIISSR